MGIVVFILKLVAISLIVDAWLYWLHRAYHSETFPAWFRKIHDPHHKEFLKSGKFHIGKIEWLFTIAIPFLATSILIHPIFFIVVLAWGWFEAARGHRYFKWFNIIPKWYYRKLKFCGIKYHCYHHEVDPSKNFGQMLKIWDGICGTKHEVTI